MDITLYKKNLKQKLLIWNIKINKRYDKDEIVITTGEYYGAKTLHFKNVKSKNIGKTNETTVDEQAVIMVKALILSQRKYGYKSLEDLKISSIDIALSTEEEFVELILNRLPKDVTDINGMLKPMLAGQYFRTKKDWVDPNGKVWKDRKYFYLKNPYELKEKGSIAAKFPMFGQPKINGVRCNIYLENDEVIMKSKEGEVYVVEHIINWFKERLHLFWDNTNNPIVYDGELYIHNEKLQYIRSAIVKPNLNTPFVTYEVYDIAVPNRSNRNRWAVIKELLKNTITVDIEAGKAPCVNVVSTFIMVNDLHVQRKTDEFIADGYEGIILRNQDADYQFGKRTINMLKLKRLMDNEFQIIGITPQENDPELGLYTCITSKGVEFNVTPTEDENYKRMMILMPHIFVNKMLTCSFYEYTDKDIPFHIVHNIVRDYENNDFNKVF